jgi:import inner membrane translocase subunit TIM22
LSTTYYYKYRGGFSHHPLFEPFTKHETSIHATPAVVGVAMGLFMGAMGDVSPLQIIQGKEVPQAPLREQVRSAFKATAGKAGGWAKSFGILTALFGGIECVIEKYRAKHDVWNPVTSGCIVGGTLSAKAGPGVSATFSITDDAFKAIHYYAIWSTTVL